jgi:hypothetical protein
MSSAQIGLWGEPQPAPELPAPGPASKAVIRQLELDRLLAIVTELPPDYWPSGFRFLAERIAEGQAWQLMAPTQTQDSHKKTTYLALALVGSDPDDRPFGRATAPMSPHARREFEAEVKRVAPLRAAIIEAMEMQA